MLKTNVCGVANLNEIHSLQAPQPLLKMCKDKISKTIHDRLLRTIVNHLDDDTYCGKLHTEMIESDDLLHLTHQIQFIHVLDEPDSDQAIRSAFESLNRISSSIQRLSNDTEMHIVTFIFKESFYDDQAGVVIRIDAKFEIETHC